jgi:serine/threonine protein kinase
MDRIGPYQIVDTLHRGPQPLFKAKAKDGQMVAVKAIPVSGLSPESRERFTREAETCRKLEHPNLVRVFEMGEADGMLYQAMELLDGADLGKVMGEGRAFTWDQKLGIMEQVCDGLEYAHANRLVHRDIKPANLFLENSGRVRVLDFGMVRVAESDLTKVGSSLGTLNYMAPEQVRGERCTAATDVFSTGIVFFQLATGRHPFSAKDRNLAQVVSAIAFEAPPKLSALAPDAPEGLEFLLNRALEKDPARRLQNAGELKGAIVLCRMTLAMGGGYSTPVTPMSARAAAPAPPGDDADKTRVMVRPSARPIVMPAAQPEDDKTRVIARPAAVAPPPPAPAPKPRPAPAPAANLRYCPACTYANPANAPMCLQCGTPFAAPAAVPAAPKSSNLPLIVAVAVALMLAIALIVVLVKK